MSGRLEVVATPIGNLGDVSARAIEALRGADVIYCEDTRRTRQLLSAVGVPAAGRLVAVHDRNEAAMCDRVVERVRDGAYAVLVSDAGTPGVSDPGERIVAALTAAGLTITTVPGPSAAIAALTVSGLSRGAFCVEGFFPRTAADRARVIERWRTEERTTVFYESPQRLDTTLRELADGLGTRQAAVVRELTKVHEEVVRGTLDELAARFADEVRGEIVVVLAGAPPRPPVSDELVRAAVRDELAHGASTRDAAAAVARALGVAHRTIYEMALETKGDREN